jgi:hypothetical protein
MVLIEGIVVLAFVVEGATYADHLALGPLSLETHE